MSNPAIQVSNLTKSYDGKAVLKNFNISVEAGTVFGLLGPNGAGKSTAVECILGTKAPDNGFVSLLGMNPQKQRKKLFEHIGVQFQESHYQDKIQVDELCELTASLYQSPAAVNDLLTQFELSSMKKRPVSELSGGEKQRLFIVLALIPNPEAVFLDELTTGLDAKARRKVWKCLLRLKSKGLTIFLTSHFMDEVEVLCDKICIIKQGEMLFTGTVKEAIETGPYERLEETYLWLTGEETEHECI